LRDEKELRVKKMGKFNSMKYFEPSELEEQKTSMFHLPEFGGSKF
jgi:hypothetical protein